MNDDGDDGGSEGWQKREEVVSLNLLHFSIFLLFWKFIFRGNPSSIYAIQYLLYTIYDTHEAIDILYILLLKLTTLSPSIHLHSCLLNPSSPILRYPHHQTTRLHQLASIRQPLQQTIIISN